MAAESETQHSVLKSSFPVLVPEHAALHYNNAEFEKFLKTGIEKFHYEPLQSEDKSEEHADEAVTLVDENSTSRDMREAVGRMGVSGSAEEDLIGYSETENEPSHPFVAAMHDFNKPASRNMENMMFTENADLAHSSTKEPLVDLFHELEEVVSGPRLTSLLEAAWAKDELATLKIIFNARSIHLGKSSRAVTYKCFGWLAQHHPSTLLLNLQWLVRPVIEKKLGEKEGDDDEMVMVEAEKADDDITKYDIQHGVAHGYWKDLLNILALAIEGHLSPLRDPKDLLNIQNKQRKSKRTWDAEKAKERKSKEKKQRHANATRAFNESSFYQALHLTVARLFAEQLKSDLVLLRKDDKKAARQISLCSKWAPSHGLFHDKHTFIVSSIAEIMYPQSEIQETTDREKYLRFAREAYRKDVSALRKALEVVERDIAAKEYKNIKYDRLPSLAMNQYAGLFAKNDTERFDDYISKVADGKKNISGATLLPSKLVNAVRQSSSKYRMYIIQPTKPKKGAKGMIEAKMKELDAKVLDGQWNALVKRIKDSGKLENSIAVADVSGSMTMPTLADKTTPLDSSIGLSLLLAEITAPPFGGNFITFSSNPKFEKVKGMTLQEKIHNLERADWEMSTDFVAVFEKLILPMARKHELKQEDMVKQVFVFSDTQFNSAGGGSRWTTSYERIKKQYELYGYEMPQLVFWNLAGGRDGGVAPKPVTADEEGTALVSGYSQGMLKVFLDNGSFEDPEAEEEIVEEEEEVDDEDGETAVQVKKKVKMDPMTTVRKAISYKSYSMLRVVD